MKRLSDVSPMSGKVGLPLRYLVVAMAAMIALPVAQADVAGKKIGDLEIYKAAEGGKTTITMMLDTSGSMSSAISFVKVLFASLSVLDNLFKDFIKPVISFDDNFIFLLIFIPIGTQPF